MGGQSCKWCEGAPDDGWTPKAKGKDKGKAKGMVMMPPFMKGGFGAWGGGFKVRDENAASTVWLGNIPPGTAHEEIKTNFEAAGTVKKVQLIKQGKEGFAWFSTPEEAQTAIAMFNGAQINGQAIVVDPWTRKEK